MFGVRRTWLQVINMKKNTAGYADRKWKLPFKMGSRKVFPERWHLSRVTKREQGWLRTCMTGVETAPKKLQAGDAQVWKVGQRGQHGLKRSGRQGYSAEGTTQWRPDHEGLVGQAKDFGFDSEMGKHWMTVSKGGQGSLWRPCREETGREGVEARKWIREEALSLSG